MAVTMLPDARLLPEVLPTERLNARGMAVLPIRADLRRIANVRNVLTIVSVWSQTLGLILGTQWVVSQTRWWPLWIPVFVLMGRGHGLFGILGHESAHRLLFSSQKLNDLAGVWLVNAPAFVSQGAYRRSHMAHHRNALGPDEPDKSLYAGYPITKASFIRKMRRDASGKSGLKVFRGLLRGLRNPISRMSVVKILSVQIVLIVCLSFTVGWWAWPVLWFAPWMTVWRVINRLRAIAEHGGMTASSDERLVTHHCKQGVMARFWMVPFHTGWHIAHHLDAGVTWRNLPRFHDELEAAGYFPDELVHHNYMALWRRLTSRPETTIETALSSAVAPAA